MKNFFIFSLSILLNTIFIDHAFAFDFIPERCSVYAKENVSFKIEDFSFDSEVHFELFFDTLGLPQARIYFLEHEPVSVAIQWNKITTKRGGKNIFTSSMEQQIQLRASLPLQLTRNNDGSIQPIFETKSTDLIQQQLLTALFISQNDLLISVESDDGNVWSGKLSLTQSDLSYRQMASRCFTQKSAVYLGLNGTRLATENQDAATAVSSGYGLVNYIDLLSLIPTFNPSAGLPSIPAENISPLLNLLEQKKNFIGITEQTFSEQDSLNEAIREHDELLQQQTLLYTKLQNLSGDKKLSIPGLIEVKKNEEKEISNAIVLIEQKIENANQNLAELTSAQNQVTEQLTPFLPQIDAFKNDRLNLNSQITTIQSFQADLSTLASAYENLLKENSVPLKTDIAENEVPWSLEEIKKKDAENAKFRQQYILVQRIKDELLSLKEESQQLVSKAKMQDESAQAYLNAVNQKQSLGNELQRIEQLILVETTIPFLSDTDDVVFTILNTQIEESLVNQNRSYENEFTFHENEFSKNRDEFVKLVANTTNENRTIFTQILCDPEIILNPQRKVRPCLNADELSNEKNRNDFIASLSPAFIDELIEQTPKPWPLQESKVDFLNLKIQQELERLSQKKEDILMSWAKIRHTIWRWATLQKSVEDFKDCDNSIVNESLNSGSYSSAFYENAFICEKTRHLRNQQIREDVFQKSIEQTLIIAETKQVYESAEKEFSLMNQTFSAKFKALVQNAENQVLLSDIYGKCLLSIENPEECSHSFDVQLQRQTDFENFANEIHLQILTRLQLYKEQNEDLTTKVAALDLEEKSFIAKNNLESLFKEKETLLLQLEQIKKEISSESDKLSKTRGQLTLLVEENKRLADEQSALLAKVAVISLDLAKKKAELNASCAQVKEMQNQQASIDLQILSLLGQDSTPTDLNSAQKFSFLRVLRFCQ